MKSVIRLLLVLTTSCYMYMAHASDAQTTSIKIAVINYAQIMQQSDQAKAAIDKLKKEFQPREQKLRAERMALNEKEAKLKRDGAVMSANDQRSLQAQILSDRRDLARQEEDYRQDLSMAQEQALQGILEKMVKAIKDIADKEKYDLILEKSRVPYASNKLDITDQVMKAIK